MQEMQDDVDILAEHRFTLRLPHRLYQALVRAAETGDRSIHAQVVRCLRTHPEIKLSKRVRQELENNGA